MRSIGPAIVVVGCWAMMNWSEIHNPAGWAAMSKRAKDIGGWMTLIAMVMFFLSWLKDIAE